VPWAAIFDKREPLAISNPPFSQRLVLPTCLLQAVATLCRPNSKNEKKRLKLGMIGRLKNAKKELQPLGDRSVELGLGLCFQQSVYGGWVAG
jgi:hypothetical protein